MKRSAWRAAIALLTAGAAHACAGKVQGPGEGTAAGPERPASDGGRQDAADGARALPAEDTPKADAAPDAPRLPAHYAPRPEDCTVPYRRDWRDLAFRENRIPPEDACRDAEKPSCYTPHTGCPMPAVCDSNAGAYYCEERILICSCVECRLPLPEPDCSWIIGSGKRGRTDGFPADDDAYTRVWVTDSCHVDELLPRVESEAACEDQRAWYVTEFMDEAQPDLAEELRERLHIALCPAACEEHRSGAYPDLDIVLERQPCMCR